MPNPEITRHPLKSDGAWVDLRDVRTVRARDRRTATEVMMSAAALDADNEVQVRSLVQALSASTDFAEHVAAMLIVKWFVPYLHEDIGAPDRATAEDIGELYAEDYDRLLELAEPAILALMPGRAATNPDDLDNPSSPSEPASDS